MSTRALAALLAAGATVAAGLTACRAVPETTAVAGGTAAAVVEIRRTPHGIAHIEAPDYESLAYGVAWAHAEDNVCQTADHLVTIRGERSAWFGPEARGLLGLRPFPNRVIDTFIRAHMDDAALERALSGLSDEAQALARGYVAGYNRFLEERGPNLPAECARQPWVRPMTTADYLRMQELTMVQLGVALFADAIVGAAPPSGESAAAPPPDVAEAARALDRFRFDEPRLGSNGWAFGAEVTDNGRGVLLGNPHFPWVGVNRFWQLHLTIPGVLDVMGASIGHSPVVQIGFNEAVAWTHTVSTGKRFTVHELELVPGDPTAYVVDGERVAMQPERVTYEARTAEGEREEREHTVWKTRYGPVIAIPDAGLNWSETRAYALKDVNTLNLRAIEIWIGLDRADSVDAMRAVLARLGVPWVNTIAADRHGSVLYADVSAVPDVDAEHLARCRPSERAAALLEAGGLVVLDGSRSACDWKRDPASPVPGVIPVERMPVAVRRDWVQNSNDSFWLSNPALDWPEFSPLVGGVGERQGLRTRSGLRTIRERLAGTDGIADHAKVGIAEAQAMLFANRSYAAELVLDDLAALCADTTGARRDACDVLAAWDRRTDLDSRGAHLFREWWRAARGVENVWRVPFDPAQPEATPAGLNIDDPVVRERLLAALDGAVAAVRGAGFALDERLGDVQHKTLPDGPVGLHGGPEIEGVLNKIETRPAALTAGGYEVEWGSSYIQAVTFDDRGPVAEAILTYGQSPHAGSPFAFDQLALYAREEWLPLPFHREDVIAATVGQPLRLTVPAPP